MAGRLGPAEAVIGHRRDTDCIDGARNTLHMEVFTGASHEDILRLLFQVALLLLAARTLGYAARRLGQPAVLGEILAGILLGPSLLSGLLPFAGEWILPQTQVQGYLLELVALLGAMFLLLATGLETDLALIKRHARTAMGVSWCGVLTSFAAGFALAQLLPKNLLVDGERTFVFAMFLGTIFAISAIPVIAKVLMDLGLMRRDIGQTIIAAGMSDDTIGWILLSVIAGLVAGEAITLGSVLTTVGGVLAFIVLSFTAGRFLIKRLLELAQERLATTDGLVTIVVALTFLWAAMTQALHFEAVLGAFVIGIVFGQIPAFPQPVRERISTLSMGVFTPVFFAITGLKVDMLGLLTPELIGITAAVIAMATIGKVSGNFIGARFIGGRQPWNALAYGAGLNAGGAMKILVATIGLQLGLLTQDMFSILVVMSIVTTLVVPFTLPRVLERVATEPEEAERLRREELSEGTLISGIRRVLLPIRLRETPGLENLEGRLLEQMATGAPFKVTLLTVCQPGEREKAVRFLERISKEFRGMDLSRRVVVSTDVARTISEESQKYHDLMVLGAPERQSSSEVLFNPLVDFLIRTAPCPTMAVKSRGEPAHWPPRSILVPTNGSHSSRRAAELAFSLLEGARLETSKAEAAGAGSTRMRSAAPKVIFLNVVPEDLEPRELSSLGESRARRLGTARHIVDGLVSEARERGVEARGEVRAGPDPESVILEVSKNQGADLILLGTDVRPGSQRLFLGPRVEWILDHAECPVLVLNAS